jgi:acetylornithine deacetylase
MKGGIAAFLAVAEAAVSTGTHLCGDLILQFVTDEETTGMGTVAVIQRGYRGDACLVPEPSAFQTWIAYRGILYGTIRTEGRPAHAEIPQPHWRNGGGISAIDAMRTVLNGIDVLNGEWRGRPDKVHPLLATPSIVPTRIAGGEFIASIPAGCEIDLDVTYLPANADQNGYGAEVRREIDSHIQAWAAATPWLRDHPPTTRWFQDYPAAEMDPQHEFVRTLLECAAEEGIDSRISGFDSWADAASYSRIGVPSACLGPGDAFKAHSIDEWVSIRELQQCARIIARLVTSWCGAS